MTSSLHVDGPGRALLQGTSSGHFYPTRDPDREENQPDSLHTQQLWRSLLNILTINCVHKVSVRTSFMRVLIGSQCKRWFTLLLIHSQKPCGEYKAISCHSSVEQTKHNPTLVSVLAELCPMNGWLFISESAWSLLISVKSPNDPWYHSSYRDKEHESCLCLSLSECEVPYCSYCRMNCTSSIGNLCLARPVPVKYHKTGLLTINPFPF